jgi:hypothetical protein
MLKIINKHNKKESPQQFLTEPKKKLLHQARKLRRKSHTKVRAGSANTDVVKSKRTKLEQQWGVSKAKVKICATNLTLGAD